MRYNVGALHLRIQRPTRNGKWLWSKICQKCIAPFLTPVHCTWWPTHPHQSP